MGKAIPLSSIGVKISYAVEATKGVMPTTGYVHIPGLKSTPSFDVTPETYDATTFDNLEYTSYVPGLKDLGGALEFTANYTQELIDVWDALITAQKAGLATNLRTWISIDIPGITKAIYIPCEASPLGMPDITTRSVIEISLFITPIGEPTLSTKPAYASEE